VPCRVSRSWPAGRGRATFILDDEVDDMAGPMTKITLDEVPIGGLAPLTPLVDPLLRSRNIVSLNALVAHLNTPARAQSDVPAEAAASPVDDAPRR
jgi:hypothetical protein